MPRCPCFNLVSQKRLYLLHMTNGWPRTFGSRPRLKHAVSLHCQTGEFGRSAGRLGCSSWSSRHMFLLDWPRTLYPGGAGCCDDISRNTPTTGLASDRAADESLSSAQVGWSNHGAMILIADRRRAQWKFLVWAENRGFSRERSSTSCKLCIAASKTTLKLVEYAREIDHNFVYRLHNCLLIENFV